MTPVAFTSGDDPVQMGLVASLARPGGNVTGVSFLLSELTGKRMELLRDLLPKAKAVGLLHAPGLSSSADDAAAANLGLRVVKLAIASTEHHGREAGQSAGRPAHQDHSGHKPQAGEGAGHQGAAVIACAGG